jgi:hypothetical protein
MPRCTESRYTPRASGSCASSPIVRRIVDLRPEVLRDVRKGPQLRRHHQTVALVQREPGLQRERVLAALQAVHGQPRVRVPPFEGRERRAGELRVLDPVGADTVKRARGDVGRLAG